MIDLLLPHFADACYAVWDNSFSLEHNTSLRRLRVSLPSELGDPQKSGKFLPWIRNVLSSITSSELELLVLEVDEDTNTSRLMSLWPQLGINDVLKEPQFNNLRQVKIHISTRTILPFYTSLRSKFRNLLKEFDEKFIVKVLVNEEPTHYHMMLEPEPTPAIIHFGFG